MTSDGIGRLKQIACAEIEGEADRITAISERILHNPETGYQEYKTAALVCAEFESLEVPYRDRLALTGVKGRLTGLPGGPTVAVMGELDSLRLADHRYADPETHAAHACGHNAQVAAMIGVAIGLQPVMAELTGDVVLLATPAEEAIENGWRQQLRDDGQIEFMVGKAELIRLGEFDDVDMAMMAHTPHGSDLLASVGDSHNGALIKNALFAGRATHAGATPWQGVNALKAATLAITAIDAHRESFKEADTVRVHAIITKGGDAVSAVPAEVTLEILVRARTVEAMTDAARKVDQALRGGAQAMGADVEIVTDCGYLPHESDETLVQLTLDNCLALFGVENVGRGHHVTASTDIGDLSYVMPVVHPRSAGTHGAPHSKDYWVRDHYKAAVNPAKYMACTVIDLLAQQALQGKEIVAGSRKLTRDQYVSLRRSLNTRETVQYMPSASPEGTRS